MLRFWFVCFALTAGCGTETMSEATEEQTTSVGDRTTGEDAESGDSPDDNCRAVGGEFGVISVRSLSSSLGELRGNRLSSPGLVVGPTGLWATFVSRDDPDERDPPGYGVELGFDGSVLGTPLLFDEPWVGGAYRPGPTAVLATYCDGDVPGWTFLDTSGQAVSPAMTPTGGLDCYAPPRATWTSGEHALVAWVDFWEACALGSACVRVAGATPAGLGTARELFAVGDLSYGPSVDIAAGADSVLVAMLRPGNSSAPVDIIVQALDFAGEAIAEATVLALPPSAEPDTLSSLEARVMADDADGFFVYVGGWGFSMGRIHVSRVGEIIEPLIALPPIVDILVWAVYNSQLEGIFPRPGGSVAVGRAVEGGQSQTLLTALDPLGEPVGHVLLHGDVVTATDGERLWALSVGGGVQLHEFGCLMP